MYNATTMQAPNPGYTQVEVAQAAKDIADVLGETLRKPRKSIGRIVRAKGIEFTREHLQQALLVQQQGGLPLADGRGTRTLGGVFFALVKRTLGARDFYTVALSLMDHRKMIAAARQANLLAAPSPRPVTSPETSNG